MIQVTCLCEHDFRFVLQFHRWQNLVILHCWWYKRCFVSWRLCDIYNLIVVSNVELLECLQMLLASACGDMSLPKLNLYESILWCLESFCWMVVQKNSYDNVLQLRMAIESVIPPWPFSSGHCGNCLISGVPGYAFSLPPWMIEEIVVVGKCCLFSSIVLFLCQTCFCFCDLSHVRNWSRLDVCPLKRGLWLDISLWFFFVLLQVVQHWCAFGDVVDVNLVHVSFLAVDCGRS